LASFKVPITKSMSLMCVISTQTWLANVIPSIPR
jgi:hypothetical protein